MNLSRASNIFFKLAQPSEGQLTSELATLKGTDKITLAKNHIIKIALYTRKLFDYIMNPTNAPTGLTQDQRAQLFKNNVSALSGRFNNLLNYSGQMVVQTQQTAPNYDIVKNTLRLYHTEEDNIKNDLPPTWKVHGQMLAMIEDSIAFLEQNMPSAEAIPPPPLPTQ